MEIKDRPILMSGPMVCATLRDTEPKTNTRRTRGLDAINKSPDSWKHCGQLADGTWMFTDKVPFEQWKNAFPKSYLEGGGIKCPYGKPGDRLWIRERLRVIDEDWELNLLTGKETRKIRVEYLADGIKSRWIDYPERLKGEPIIGKCLSYGGYRESSRINLEITAIRVERLQDISPSDCHAEGIPPETEEFNGLDIQDAFSNLWESINGPGSWDKNDWVWVVSYKRVVEPVKRG